MIFDNYFKVNNNNDCLGSLLRGIRLQGEFERSSQSGKHRQTQILALVQSSAEYLKSIFQPFVHSSLLTIICQLLFQGILKTYRRTFLFFLLFC